MVDRKKTVSICKTSIGSYLESLYIVVMGEFSHSSKERIVS